LTQSATNVFLSLLKQLLRQLGPSDWPSDLFQKLSQTRSDVSVLNIREVSKFVLDCASQFSDVFFIFDALDECEDPRARKKLIDFINTATQLNPRVKILFTSRTNLPGSDFVSHKSILIKAHATDIEGYVRANLEHKRYSDELRDEIVSKIIARSDGQ